MHLIVYTESRIRKLIKDGKRSVEQKYLKLSNDDKLTQLQKVFLHDRAIFR